MAQRLTLSTVGIKSPLDVNQNDEPATPPRQPRAKSASPPRAARALQVAEPAPADRTTTPAPAPFYGTGRPVQTSIAINEDCSERLDELARATGASVNTLAIAAIHAALPATSQAARELIVQERIDRAGERRPRIERNLRLPRQLRTRADEFVAAARAQLPRGTRADLLNAALRHGLPADPQAAAQLVTQHARRVEQAAASG